jgi:hypothetical protein
MAFEFQNSSIRNQPHAGQHLQCQKVVQNFKLAKVIELCLEVVDSIPKPLQWILLYSTFKGTLGFTLRPIIIPAVCILSSNHDDRRRFSFSF